MTDYMLTVITNLGARDVQVSNGASMLEAIAITEKETGCRVDHGRSGIGSRFDPALIIEATNQGEERSTAADSNGVLNATW